VRRAIRHRSAVYILLAEQLGWVWYVYIGRLTDRQTITMQEIKTFQKQNNFITKQVSHARTYSATTNWLSPPAGCHHQLAVTTSWLSPPAGCHHQLAVTTNWLSPPTGCYHQLAVTQSSTNSQYAAKAFSKLGGCAELNKEKE